jgi:drug/metabolite transporter (DMT)-like permease
MSESALRAPAGKVALALGIVYVVWGSTYYAIRVGLETITPFFMASARYLLAGAVVYAFCRWRGTEKPTWPQWRSALLLGWSLLLVGNGGVVWAEQRVSSGLAALMVSTEPIWIVLLVWSRDRQRPRFRVFAGMALGFTGLMILLSPGAGAHLTAGVAVALLLASASWASGSLYSIRAALPASPLLGTAMQMLCGGMLLALAGLVSGEPGHFAPALVSARSMFGVLYLSVFGSMIAFSAYIWLLRAAPPVLVSTYAYVNPVVAVLLGWFAGHELLSRGTLIGAAVILVGVAMIVSAPSRATADSPPADRPQRSPSEPGFVAPETGPAEVTEELETEALISC